MSQQNKVKAALEQLSNLMATLVRIKGEGETVEIALARLDAVEAALWKLEAER